MPRNPTQYLLILSFIVLILLIHPVKAEVLTFNILGESDFTMCSCEQRVTTLYPSFNPQILVANSQSEFVDLTINYLNESQNYSITERITVPCDYVGEKIVALEVQSEYGILNVGQRILANKCDNIGLNLYPILKACPGQEVSFPITLTNPATFFESYKFSADFDISQNSILLAPGESKEIISFFRIPNSDFENQTITLSIISESNKLQKDVQIYVNQENCYDFEANIPENNLVCTGEQIDIPLTVKTNTPIILELNEDSKYSWFDSKAFVFENDQQALLHFKSNKEGIHTIHATIKSPTDMIESNINVMVADCDKLIINVPSKLKITDCQQTQQEVILENRGVNDLNPVLALDSPGFVSINQINTIKGGENHTVYLQMSPCDNIGEYNVLIEDTTTQSKTKVVLEVIEGETTQPVVSRDGLKIILSDESVNYKGKDVSFEIYNNDDYTRSFTASISGPDFLQFPSTPLSIVPGEKAVLSYSLIPIEDYEPKDYSAQLILTAPNGTTTIEEFTITLTKFNFPLFEVLAVLAVILLIIIIVIVVMITQNVKTHDKHSIEDQLNNKELHKSTISKEEKTKQKSKEVIIDTEVTANKITKKERTPIQIGKKAYILWAVIIIIFVAAFLLPKINNQLSTNNITQENVIDIVEDTGEPSQFMQYLSAYKYYLILAVLALIILIIIIEIVRTSKR